MISVTLLDVEEHVVLKRILNWLNKKIEGKPVPQYLSGKNVKK
jgi:hypothetical protein